MYRSPAVSPNAAMRTDLTNVETKLKKYSKLTVKGCSRRLASHRRGPNCRRVSPLGQDRQTPSADCLAKGVASAVSECDDWPFAISRKFGVSFVANSHQLGDGRL